jgi:endonuclease YncB( thermonuclease family)
MPRRSKLKVNLSRFLPWLGLILLLPSLLLNYFLLKQSSISQEGIKVIGVIDGDTIVLDGKVRLRLRHIDAPELEFCGGQQAKDLLTDLVDGKSVVIKEKILDQHGRAMALAYIGDELINQTMLASGWVRFHHDQSSQADALQQASYQAREAKLGIFSPLCWQKENPDNPDCNIKGNIDKSTKVKKYYYPGCAQYQFTVVEKDTGEAWFCTEKEAKEAGFAKAATCR